MRTVYIDVLLILNLYVNWLLLRGTARLTHTPLSSGRCILAAGLGSLTSLTVLLPSFNLPVTLLIKLSTAVVPVGAAFGVKPLRGLLRCFAVFLTVSFVFAGLCLALCTLTGTDVLIWSGSCIYLHFSLVSLILCTALAYFLLRVFSYIRMRSSRTDESFEVIIRIGTHMTAFPGLCDTGNSLCDCFTGKPVIIIGRDSLKGVDIEKIHGYRLIPYGTVLGEGLMPVFSPDEVIIKNLSTGRLSSADVLIGKGEKPQTAAIFNPKLLHTL